MRTNLGGLVTMNVKSTERKGNETTIVVEIDKELMESGVNKAYMKARKNIMIPGFRKGKAPRKMIEQMYGKEVFYEEAANNLIPSVYAKAVDECEEEIVSQPVINVVQAEAGKTFIFTAEVALKPEVTLGTYKGVEVQVADVTVTDEEVDAAIEKERENNDVIKREFVNEQKNANSSFSYKSDDETLANTVENTYSRMDSEYEPLKN